MAKVEEVNMKYALIALALSTTSAQAQIAVPTIHYPVIACMSIQIIGQHLLTALIANDMS
jgi:hypothetical protein